MRAGTGQYTAVSLLLPGSGRLAVEAPGRSGTFRPGVKTVAHAVQDGTYAPRALSAAEELAALSRACENISRSTRLFVDTEHSAGALGEGAKSRCSPRVLALLQDAVPAHTHSPRWSALAAPLTPTRGPGAPPLADRSPAHSSEIQGTPACIALRSCLVIRVRALTCFACGAQAHMAAARDD